MWSEAYKRRKDRISSLNKWNASRYNYSCDQKNYVCIFHLMTKDTSIMFMFSFFFKNVINIVFFSLFIFLFSSKVPGLLRLIHHRHPPSTSHTHSHDCKRCEWQTIFVFVSSIYNNLEPVQRRITFRLFPDHALAHSRVFFKKNSQD